MYYIIQKNLFREEGYDKLIKTLDRFNISYELINVSNDKETLDFNTDREDVFIFGSLKLARLSKQYNWFPGTLITKNHDYDVYSKHYKENLLNYDSRIVKFGNDFEWISDKHFIRPTLDSKVFTGRVFTYEEWTNFKNNLLPKTTITNETLLQVATVKNITQEIRFWIIDGKIVTQSTYRRGTYIAYDDIVDNDAIEYVKQMIKIFQLAKAFTIDICLSEYRWKIVECGSIACAGFYDADMQKIIMSLEEAYNLKIHVDGIDGDIYKYW